MRNAYDRIASVGGAVVTIGERKWGTRLTRAAGVAGFGSVAHVAVGARRSGFRCVAYTTNRVAGVGSAWVAVVNIERRTWLANARNAAGLDTVAHVVVGA